VVGAGGIRGVDMAVSTRSTLRVSARSGGYQVLGLSPVIGVVVAGAVFTVSSSFPLHLWTTLQAAARSGGGCWLMLGSAGPGAVAASLAASIGGCLSFETLVVAKAPVIHPTSSCSSVWGWVLCRPR
jgi:hypothetical protein